MTDELTIIRSDLRNVYAKVSVSSTLPVGIEFFKRLIKENLHSKQRMMFILNELYEHMKMLTGIEKKEVLYLLPCLFPIGPQIIQALPYLTKTLQILQTSINRVTEQISTFIAGTLGEILITFFIESNTHMTNNQLYKTFEEVKEFCFFLINVTQNYPYQICGCLFLYKLIETAHEVYYADVILKDLLMSIFSYLDMKKFIARKEILQCLTILIQKTNDSFIPFIEITIDKIIPCLRDGNWMNKKMALNSLYLITKNHREKLIGKDIEIVELLYHLKEDKIKEIRMIALKILKILNDDDFSRKGYNSHSSGFKKDFSQSTKMIDRDKEQFLLSQRDNNSKGKQSPKKDFILVEKSINHHTANSSISINHNPIDHSIDLLVYQIRDISRNQHALIKMVDNIQLSFQKSMDDITRKTNILEAKIRKIEVQETQNNEYDTKWNSIVELISKGFIDKGIVQSFEDDYLLLKLINFLNSKKIKSINNRLLEDIFGRLIIITHTKKDHEDNAIECIEKIYRVTEGQLQLKPYIKKDIQSIIQNSKERESNQLFMKKHYHG